MEMSGLAAALVDLLIVVTIAAVISAVVGLGGRHGRKGLWRVAAVIGATALLAQWLLPSGIPLMHHHCSPLCGGGGALMPAAGAFSALGAAGMLSVRHHWAPPRLRGALAFIVSLLMLLGGVRTWIA